MAERSEATPAEELKEVLVHELGDLLYAERRILTMLKTLVRDIQLLNEHVSFELTKINFLLDATLGMINIEQNRIIKLFSVAAVVFLPPTLVASIYGMNFRHMPELDWEFGYPLALGVMAVVTFALWRYFKRKGWL